MVIQNQTDKISEMYKVVSDLIPTNAMREIVYAHVESYLHETRNKSLQERCIEFYFIRQSFLSVIRHNSNFTQEEWFSGIGDSVLDYFDMTFSYLFFNGLEGKCALEKKVDKEFYFCLMTDAMDRIEFPSLISDQLLDSYHSNNRRSVSLERRNYLATTMTSAKPFVNKVIEETANCLRRVPSWEDLRKTYKRNIKSFNVFVANYYDSASKKLNASKCGERYRLYRGYEIKHDQDVIIERKVRKQDANKAVSFTTEKIVAEMYANYRTLDSSKSSAMVLDQSTTSMNARITLARTMFSDRTDYLLYSSGRKCIVSEYLVPEDDIILFPMSTTITECEVFAIPDNALLTRYTIVNSLQ
jgi:hypothetical protein